MLLPDWKIAMPSSGLALERRVLSGFKQGYAEHRLDVAEHLIRALKILDPDWSPGSAAAEAYMTICNDRRPRARGSRTRDWAGFRSGISNRLART